MVDYARVYCQYEEDCPTCGGTVEFEVFIAYDVVLKGKKVKRYHRVRNITFDEILRQLFLLTD